ncbi:hypothetical protein AB4341_17755 [Vibrio breoganii]
METSRNFELIREHNEKLANLGTLAEWAEKVGQVYPSLAIEAINCGR